MNHKPDSSMGNIIRAEFRKSGLSVRRLSLLAKVPYASVHAVVAGERDPILSTADKLCCVLRLELRPVRRCERKG